MRDQYGDTLHTVVQKGDYKGAFLPGYHASEGALKWVDPLEALLYVP